MPYIFSSPIAYVICFLSILFIFVVGTAVLIMVIIFILDKLQTKDAIRHNYPVIGRLRPLFNVMGDFFRRYFFAMDSEEMPFKCRITS